MTQRFFQLAVSLATAILIPACASGPSVDPAVSAAVSSKGVNSGTYQKICNARVLDYTDIMNLVQRDVPSTVIISYLQSTQKTYNFTYAELQSLRSAGASPQVLNYLTETQGFYGNNSPKQTARLTGEQKRAYYNSPYYQAQQPFAYSPPMISTWYDSGYEESLYSPFSFN